MFERDTDDDTLKSRLALAFQLEYTSAKITATRHGIEWHADIPCGQIQLEHKPNTTSLCLRCTDWSFLIACTKSDSSEISIKSHYVMSYGPNTSNGFFYETLHAFISDYWPELLKLIPNSDGNIMRMGIRDLFALIPEEQRMNPNSPFMQERFTTLMRTARNWHP